MWASKKQMAKEWIKKKEEIICKLMFTHRRFFHSYPKLNSEDKNNKQHQHKHIGVLAVPGYCSVQIFFSWFCCLVNVLNAFFDYMSRAKSIVVMPMGFVLNCRIFCRIDCLCYIKLRTNRIKQKHICFIL